MAENSRTEIENLEILGDAISDVGYWSWWVTELPNIFQIEFGGTQLYFPTSDIAKPPSGQIALQFKKPTSISFLNISDKEPIGKVKWYDLLQQDQMEPVGISYGYFTLTDDKLIEEILRDAKLIETIHGYSPKTGQFLDEKFKLVFWAGEYGLAASGAELSLWTQDGEIDLDQIPDINNKWWDYWKEYWKLKKEGAPLHYDYACEVTIPIEE